VTAERCRPPQDSISSNILGTAKVQAAINHDKKKRIEAKTHNESIQVQF